MHIIPLNTNILDATQIKEELLSACKNQDRKAQKMLYEYCFRAFMPLCCRYNNNEEDARIAFNNAFLKIIDGLGSINIKELNFLAWAKRIVTNVLIDEYRKNKLHKAHYLAKETEKELEKFAICSENEAESNFGYDDILKLIEEIPQTHALVFKLYVLEGMSHREISNELKMNEGTCKWHLSVARKLLREKLEMLYKLKQKTAV